MADKPPTLRERAIATSPRNPAALRDLIIDMAEIMDKQIADAHSAEQNNSEIPE